MTDLDTRLTQALVCPVCKGPIRLSEDRSTFVCAKCALAYPIRDGVPVMMEVEASAVPAEELEKYRVKPAA